MTALLTPLCMVHAQVRCSLTGHEMPARVQDILAYVNGQKYKRLRSLADYDYSAVEPYLVQSNRRR